MTKTWIQLGKYGDICNILPLLHHDAQNGPRPRLMVAAEYAPILEGVSYVEPLIFEGPHYEIANAVEQAKPLGPWICTQVNGPINEVKAFVYEPARMETARTTSFAKEQWRVADRLGEWINGYPLVFDRRVPDREAALLQRVTKKKKTPFVLVHADGVSSPFPYKELLLELVKYCGFSVIDLGQVKADRIFDLIGLFELAHCLITTDSALMHLAQACPSMPVLALANDKPLLWNGSPWRPSHEWYCRYSDFPLRAVEMLRTIRTLKPIDPDKLRIAHVWVGGPGDAPPSDVWKPTPIMPGMCARLGPASNPNHVYLRDVIRIGIQRARNGWVCLTREGTQLCSDLDRTLQVHTAAYAYRMNRKDGQDEYAPVVDLFSASADWWRLHLDKIPDLLIGPDYWWSHTLWALFEQQGAIDVTGMVWREVQASKKGQTVAASTDYNSQVCGHFVTDNKVTARYRPVFEQLDHAPLDTSSLKPFGYNPSIYPGDDGYLWLAYRFHPNKNTRSLVCLSQVDEGGTIISNKVLSLDTGSGAAEDPKLFAGADPRFPALSFVMSGLPRSMVCVTRYTQLVNGKPESIITPAIGKNDLTAMEKNWVFWYWDKSLYCLYQCAPVHRIYRLEGARTVEMMESDPPTWGYGEIRGGTPPLPFDVDLAIRFFHSHLDNEWAGSVRRRYFIGAYLMKNKPPFEVVRVTKRPILYGSEIDEIRVKDRPHHWKANVVFAGGATTTPEGWTLAVGVNDSACFLAKIRACDLNL